MTARQLAMLALTLPATPLLAGPIDALNSVRMHPCKGHPVAQPLRANPQLNSAARRMAHGQSLEVAMRVEAYRADRSSALHFSGEFHDADIERALRRSFCSSATEQDLTEAGVFHLDSQTWIIMAVPINPPSTRAAGAISEQILRRVNAARAHGRSCGRERFGPAAPLQLEPTLMRAALNHAGEMARFGRLEHRAVDGSTPADRLTRAGYKKAGAVGENIAGGAQSAGEVMDGWLASSGHCANIMNPHYSQMGIGYAVNRDSPLAIYWAQEFAAPQR